VEKIYTLHTISEQIQHSRNWLHWQDQFWLCKQQVLRQNEFFSALSSLINAKRSSPAPSRANKIIFMKTIVLLQHLKTTKLGYIVFIIVSIASVDALNLNLLVVG